MIYSVAPIYKIYLEILAYSIIYALVLSLALKNVICKRNLFSHLFLTSFALFFVMIMWLVSITLIAIKLEIKKESVEIFCTILFFIGSSLISASYFYFIFCNYSAYFKILAVCFISHLVLYGILRLYFELAYKKNTKSYNLSSIFQVQ